MSLTPYRIPIVSEIRKQTIYSLLKKGLRDDERDLYTPRRIEIQLGVIEKAEGSALVKLGNTQVLAGVKVEVGSPFRDTPDEGVLTVNAEFVPLASPYFEPGPPDENAVELARVVDRSLREVMAVDRKSLVLIPGEKVWVVFVDLYILDHDGNLFDASMLAAMAALLNTRLPEYEELETGEIQLNKDNKKDPLKINHIVVSSTVARIGDVYVVDPNLDEEVVADARLFMAFDEQGRVVGIQKVGTGGLKPDEILKIIDIGRNSASVYFKALQEAFSDTGLPVEIRL
ncbi:MAG: exosome complex protein Rrp42 [Desulfurococcales archaeon]|nr:exosome complex protein Rrp42 [Desulfurococcales archaeon]MEB3789788.1 exosome complex protein Rrp42 [Desulfurococcales archaeon]